MLKKLPSIFLSLIFVFSSLNTAFAQTRINTDIQINTNASNNAQERIKERIETRQEIQQLRREKQAEIRARIEAKTATREAKLEEINKRRIENLYSVMTKRMLSAAERLITLIDRIESRLADIEEINPDADTESVLLTLSEAETLVMEAQTDIESLNSVVGTILESEDPKTAFEDVRDTIKDAKVKLVEAHRLLAGVIGDIRGLRVGQNEIDGDDPVSESTNTGSTEE